MLLHEYIPLLPELVVLVFVLGCAAVVWMGTLAMLLGAGEKVAGWFTTPGGPGEEARPARPGRAPSA